MRRKGERARAKNRRLTRHGDRVPLAQTMTQAPLRIGVLGAARIAPPALLRPARAIPEVSVVAIAARDPRRARSFAARHGIPRVHGTYAELVGDPDVDAVYNPLPNSLHCEWTVRALEAGKHVLCEKPLAANASEAEQMARAASSSGRVLMEAFHYRYHPLAQRMIDLVKGGTLGRVERIEANMCALLPLPGDIRYSLELAGGATMDMGCYCVHMVRHLAGDEPVVTSAEARLSSPQVDRWMEAHLFFADGRTGRIHCSLFSSTVLDISVRVVGDRGELRALNPVAPQFFHRLTVRDERGKTVERFDRRPSYEYQLRAFVDAVTNGTRPLTGPADSIANMRVIDAIYEKAGLPARGTLTPR
jgi:predicted dehydrogenase